MKIARVKEFLREVHSKSEEGVIIWKATADDDVFSAVVSQGRYVLKAFSFTEYDDGDKHGPPSLGIFNKQNRLVVDITSSVEDVAIEALEKIYLTARRKALGIEDAIDDILIAINTKDDDIPF